MYALITSLNSRHYDSEKTVVVLDASVSTPGAVWWVGRLFVKQHNCAGIHKTPFCDISFLCGCFSMWPVVFLCTPVCLSHHRCYCHIFGHHGFFCQCLCPHTCNCFGHQYFRFVLFFFVCWSFSAKKCSCCDPLANTVRPPLRPPLLPFCAVSI